MKFTFSDEEEAFRAEVKEFLKDYQDLNGFFDQGHDWPSVREFFKAMAAKGYLSVCWPEEYGGLNKSASYEYIVWDEVAYARCARPPLGPGIVAKTIIRYGDDEQKKRWLKPLRDGEMHFSLAYSEPEAGSDLASVRCRAELKGDKYIVNGQKCWQSYAQDMDYFWLLCRTGTQESRGRGCSLMIVPKDAPGITVAPLPLMDDDQLNEVFFDNVEIPVNQRIGPENGAWKLMNAALADERHIQFPPSRLRRDLEDVISWTRDQGLLDDPVVRNTLGDLASQVLEGEVLGLSVLDAMLRGEHGVMEAAANKVAQTISCQNIARAVTEFGGPESLVKGTLSELIWRQSMWETIGGGTSEIMRGVIARNSLGLVAKT